MDFNLERRKKGIVEREKKKREKEDGLVFLILMIFKKRWSESSRVLNCK